MKFFVLLLLVLFGCSSPLLRLQYQSLGYVRLAKVHPTEQTQPCLTAAVSSAKAVQAFLEARTLESWFGTTPETEAHHLKVHQAYSTMKTACQSFGTPHQAEMLGTTSKELPHVAND